MGVKSFDVISVYWPVNARHIEAKKKLVYLARKEGRSPSWIIREAIFEYLKNHGSGNPQTDMRVFTGEVEPPPALRTCHICGKGLATGEMAVTKKANLKSGSSGEHFHARRA